MKEQVRRGVFETNSSSVHTITLCTQCELDAWKAGELWLDFDEERLITTEAKDIAIKNGSSPSDFLSYTDFQNIDEYETYSRTHTTPLGETVIAFGVYGYD